MIYETFPDMPIVEFDATCTVCGDTEDFFFLIEWETTLDTDMYEDKIIKAGWKRDETQLPRKDQFMCPVCVKKLEDTP